MDYEKIEGILEVKIKDKDLYKKAFTHRSYLNENPDYKLPSNERLEFLGDAILQFLSSEYLFDKYKKRREGELTAIRASIVNTKSLAYEGGRLGYGEFLLLSKGEESTGGRSRPYILANTFEAVLGAVYIDNDINKCRDFLTKNLFYKVEEIVSSGEYRDNKSTFQELAQEKHNVTPTYEVLKEWGPDHDKKFEVGVYLNKKLIAKGKGKSKQKAESNAAGNAIDLI